MSSASAAQDATNRRPAILVFAHNAFRTTLLFHTNSKKSLALTLGVHLQGYVQFEKKAVLNSAKKILFGDKNHRVHLEFSKHY